MYPAQYFLFLTVQFHQLPAYNSSFFANPIFMKIFIRDFIICGITGWCMEIIFTSLGSFLSHNYTLTGHTSLWMFPIYGMAAFIFPLYQKIAFFPIWLRASLYAELIFIVEFITGILLKNYRICPWNYEGAAWNLAGVIRLDYFFFWCIAGLIFESILCKLRMSNKKIAVDV